MGTYSKIILSGSTDGAGINASGTAPSLGALIHTAVTGAAQSIDEVWLYAYCQVTTARDLGVCIGPTTNVNSRFTYTITADDQKGLYLVMPGMVCRNAALVKAYTTAATGGINVFGYVNRFAT